MLFSLNYIIYMAYSFLILITLYICLIAYKKYSFITFDSKDKIILSEKSSIEKNKFKNNNNSSKNTLKISNLKKHYKIKSTEKTYEEIKFCSNKPNYVNTIVLNQNNQNIKFNFDINFIQNIMMDNKENLKKIKDHENDETTQKIITTYIYTKQFFFNTFVNDKNDEYLIKNLNDFCIFYKKITEQKKHTENNILLKFYNENLKENSKENVDSTYVYISDNNIIKIKYNKDYDKLCDMIEKNNGIFLLDDSNININCKYYLGYGNYVQQELNSMDIKNVFFSNNNNYQNDKNYILFSKFKFIKIYFFVCNEICL